MNRTDHRNIQPMQMKDEVDINFNICRMHFTFGITSTSTSVVFTFRVFSPIYLQKEYSFVFVHSSD
jgi:hypothetical protein